MNGGFIFLAVLCLNVEEEATAVSLSHAPPYFFTNHLRLITVILSCANAY